MKHATDHAVQGITRRWLLAIFVAALQCLQPGESLAQGRSVTVAAAEYSMPLPGGYVDFCDIDEDAASDFPSFVPDSNEFLSCYATPSDVKEWQDGTGGLFSSYLIATVMKGTIARNASAQEFAAFSSSLKKSLTTLASRLPASMQQQIDLATATLSSKYDIDARTTLNSLVPIGAFDEGADRISTVWLADATHEVEGQTVNDRQVQVSSSVLVNGKLFVLFTYGKLESTADVERYKKVARE